MQTKSLRAAGAALAVATALFSGTALAQVDVSGAWTRGTVPAQTATAAYMTLRAHEPARLLGVSTPVAATAEVHEMKMEGDVMRMRALKTLDLPKMQDVELKPNGYHVMLMGLKAPLKEGDSVPLTLKIEQGGKIIEQQVKAEVRGLGASAPMPAGAMHKH